MAGLSETRVAVPRTARQWRTDRRQVTVIERDVAEEAPIGLAYDSRPHVVLMGTPADVEDLALGFTLTERIATAAQVARITVTPGEAGLLADVLLSRDAGAALAVRRRTIEARSSCGLCGLESLDQAVRPPVRVGEGPMVAREAVRRALRALDGGQTLGARTRATHAAAWIDLGGCAAIVREDVGRHNALDKVVGAAARVERDPARAMIVVTSRCSFEMVDKTAAAGVAILVAISAPTALAIRQAERAGMTLIALARADGHAVFTRPERIASA